jgi:hypothetical protein
MERRERGPLEVQLAAEAAAPAPIHFDDDDKENDPHPFKDVQGCAIDVSIIASQRISSKSMVRTCRHSAGLLDRVPKSVLLSSDKSF